LSWEWAGGRERKTWNAVKEGEAEGKIDEMERPRRVGRARMIDGSGGVVGTRDRVRWS